MFFRELEYMFVSMDGVLTLLSVTLLCFYYSLIVALVSVTVLSKFLSVYLVGFVAQVLPCCPPGSFQANGY